MYHAALHYTNASPLPPPGTSQVAQHRADVEVGYRHLRKSAARKIGERTGALARGGAREAQAHLGGEVRPSLGIT